MILHEGPSAAIGAEIDELVPAHEQKWVQGHRRGFAGSLRFLSRSVAKLLRGDADVTQVPENRPSVRRPLIRHFDPEISRSVYSDTRSEEFHSSFERLDSNRPFPAWKLHLDRVSPDSKNPKCLSSLSRGQRTPRILASNLLSEGHLGTPSLSRGPRTACAGLIVPE